jgi:hypothetical protein
MWKKKKKKKKKKSTEKSKPHKAMATTREINNENKSTHRSWPAVSQICNFTFQSSKNLDEKKKKKKNQTKRKKKRTSRRRVEERQHAKKKDKTNERTYIRFVMNDAPMVEGWSSE